MPSAVRRRPRAPGRVSWGSAAVILALLSGACAVSDEPAHQTGAVSPPSSERSSGALAFTGKESPDPADPEAAPAGGSEYGIADETESVADEDPAEETERGFVAPARPDGIELVFDGRTLGPIAPGTTIDDISEALGPLYVVSPEEFIRVGFASGYSVSRGGRVVFWAVEEDGVITHLMSEDPRVGLDSGLRPTMNLGDAIAIHGEPTLTLGPESREFASFPDGIDEDSGVSVLVAIGRFGGPVGVYPGRLDAGEQTSRYVLEDATIKELWFELVEAEEAEQVDEAEQSDEAE